MSGPDLYKARVFKYFRDSRFAGRVDEPDFQLDGRGVLCADTVHVSGKICDGKIDQIKFQVQGCLVATACANMLGEFLTGKTVDQALELSEQSFIDDVAQVPVQTSRRECALLALVTTKKTFKNFL